MLKGKVTGVSQDAIIRNKPPEKAASHNESGSLSSSSEPDGQKLYSARVSLDRTQMQVEDKLVNLASGIAVTVEVRTGSRRSIEYLMSPLRRYKQESMGRVGGDRGDQEQPLGPESHSNCIADLFRPSRVVRQGISPLAQIF